jgi:hypothetical protein
MTQQRTHTAPDDESCAAVGDGSGPIYQVPHSANGSGIIDRDGLDALSMRPPCLTVPRRSS